MLSTAYLMDGRPQGANSILMKRRENLQENEFREAAAFLSSLARFKAAVLPDRQEREGRDLVTALTRFKPETQFGAHWSFLHAEACLELGLIEMAVASFQQTIRTLQDWIHPRSRPSSLRPHRFRTSHACRRK